MATSFGSSVPTLVFYRVHREGQFAKVRVSVGEVAPNPVGVLLMLPSEFLTWRRSLLDYDPARLSVWYGDGVYEWLHPHLALEVVAPR